MVLGITGASGALGRLAVEVALETIPPSELVISTRSPDAVRDLADRGVEVRYADFDEPASLETAFAGIDRMFMVSASNFTGKRYEQHRTAISAASDAGVLRLVFPSMPKVNDPRHPVEEGAGEYRDAEQRLLQSGIGYTVLRNAPYIEMHLIDRMLPSFAAGEMRMNTGRGRVAPISRGDVARAAVAAALTPDERHLGCTYDITGPELLTFEEIAGLLAEVSGRDLHYVDLDDETFAREAAAAGMPDTMLDTLTSAGRAMREGWFAVCTDDYRMITGRDQLSVRQVLEAHRDTLVRADASQAGP